MALMKGQNACFSKTVTESDVYGFAGITGDFNRVHIDEEKAKNGTFGERIAHGFLTAGFISTVLGMYLPGPGTILLNQSLNFKRPVKIGDTITAKATVMEVLKEDEGIYKLETVCTNQFQEVVIDGEAVVKYAGELRAQDTGRTDTFYSSQELKSLGLKRCGKNVFISRNAVLYHPEQLEIGNNVRIDDFTTISGKIVLGDYIHIAQFCGLYGGSEGIFMDDFSGISSKVTIYATSNDYSGNSMTNPMVPAKYKTTDKSEAVRLCRHVVVGSGSVILPGVTIKEGSSVGAMSLCGKSLDAWGVYAGAPAKRLKERSKKLLQLERRLRDHEAAAGGGGYS